MLAVLLHESGLLPATGGSAQFAGAQGRHVNRPGRVDVELALDQAGRPQSVSIAGQAVVVLEGSAVF